MHTALKYFLAILNGISVEPAILLYSIYLSMYMVFNDVGMYRVICDKMFNTNGGTPINNHSSFDCWNTSHALGVDLDEKDKEWWPEAEIQLQQQAASYNMAASFTWMVPSMFSNIPVGAYADRHGRKKIIAIGFFFSALCFVPLPIVFYAPRATPLYVLYIVNTICSFFLNISAPISGYLADTVKDKEMLPVRITIVQMCGTIAFFMGPQIANGLLNVFSYAASASVDIGVQLLAFFCVLVFLRDIKPQKKIEDKSDEKIPDKEKVDVEKAQEMDHDQEISQENVDKENPHEKIEIKKVGRLEELKGIILSVPHLVVETLQTAIKKREGNQRIYIFICAYVVFAFSVAVGTIYGVIFSLYVQKDPLRWTKKEISDYTSAGSLAQLCGGTLGIFIFKKLLHISDSLIIIISLASTLGQAVLIILAKVSWVLFISIVAGVMTPLANPCLFSFIAKMLKPDEVGKVYALLSFSMNTGFVFSGVAVGAIYRATVEVFPRCIFVVGAGILSIALLMVVWLHLDMNGYKISAQKKIYQVQ